MSRKTESKRIKEISEGHFHSIHASNKAEKFKFSKLSQGIESCRNAQAMHYRKEEKELQKMLQRLNKEKSKHLTEEEAYFLKYCPGDGIAMMSFCDFSALNELKETPVQGNSSNNSEVHILGAETEETKNERNDSNLTETIEETVNVEERNRISSANSCIRKESINNEDKQQKYNNNDEYRDDLSSSLEPFNLPRKSSLSKHGSSHPRRSSIVELEEVVPFYLKKKYDHHYERSDTATKENRGRTRMRFEDENQQSQGRSLAPSADLDTITFNRTTPDRTWLNKDMKKEKEEAIRRQPSEKIEIVQKHRPLSGFKRVSLALERIPSTASLPRHCTVTTHTRRPIQNLNNSSESIKRRHSLPGNDTSALSTKEILDRRLHMLGQRRHTVGEIFHHDLMSRNMESNTFSRSLHEVNSDQDSLSFDDGGVVFPAYDKNTPYTFKEFISLRKCRYLRLSKLNLESLQLQSKLQHMADF